MFLRNFGLSVTRRAAFVFPKLRPKSFLRPRTLPALHPLRQTRFASYQRFPGTGGSTPKWTRFGPFARVTYIFQNYQKTVLVVAVGGGTFYVFNLEEVPVTHRRRFNCISPELEKQIGGGGYEQVLQQYQGKILPETHQYTQMVARVVQRLLPSTGGLAGEEWMVHVIDEPKEKNAFVMPGGKVFVFTGIIPIAQNEDGLAVVLGHEIAHNVAHHVSERISRSGFVSIFALGAALLFDISGQTSQFIIDLLLSLPNSRTQEEEADHIGLLMMAESCFDPNAAVGFWHRMHAAEQGAPPQFLSTHPSSSNRQARLEALLPQANRRRESSECGRLTGYAEDFKRTFGKQSPTGRLQVVGQPQQVGSGENDDFF